MRWVGGEVRRGPKGGQDSPLRVPFLEPDGPIKSFTDEKAGAVVEVCLSILRKNLLQKKSVEVI